MKYSPEEYLNKMVSNPDRRKPVLSLIRLLMGKVENLPEPDIGVSEDEDILITWNKDGHHFEVEFPCDNDTKEYFYCNHSRKEEEVLKDDDWCLDCTATEEVPEKAFTYLKLFVENSPEMKGESSHD